MKVEFGYGKGVQTVDIPDRNLDQVLVANEIEHERRGPEAVVYALENPIGSPRLKDLVTPGQKICIITSDISRPIPSFDVIPSILDELYLAGCDRKDIKVVFALGSKNVNKKNFARSYFCYTIIVCLVAIVIFAIMMATGAVSALSETF